MMNRTKEIKSRRITPKSRGSLLNRMKSCHEEMSRCFMKTSNQGSPAETTGEREKTYFLAESTSPTQRSTNSALREL